jgi:hypothetical protein
MVDYNDFRCRIHIPEIDLRNTAAARQAVLSVINDPAFETMLSDLRVAATQAKAGPAPRGGDVSIHCEANTHGGVSCGGGVTIRF